MKIALVLVLLLIIGCASKEVKTIVLDNNELLEETIVESINSKQKDLEKNNPSNSLVIFYTAHLGRDSDSLPVQIQEVSPQGENLGGRGEIITVETDYYAILGYLPEYDKTYLIHKTFSPSYASSFVYPVTKNGKLFLFQDWGIDEGKNEVKNGWVIDPKTGEQLHTLSFTGNAAQLAVVRNKIYYRSAVSENIYGKRSSGGEFYVLNLGATPRMMLEYGDSDNQGRLLGGDQLYSYLNGQIRTHDELGNIMTTYQVPSEAEFYESETGIYYTIQDGNSYDVYKYSSLGGQFILSLTLDAGEVDVRLDEEDGNLIISSWKDSSSGIALSSVLVYNLQTEESKNIEVNQLITRTSPGPNGNQFWLLE